MTRLPDGWAITELDEINDAERPICYGILKPGPDLPGGVPYVKVKNIRDQQVNLSGLHRTSSAIHEKYHRSRLQPGDLLISIRGTYGRVAPVPAELADANITQDSARIAPVGVRADYLQQYLQGPIAQGYLAGVARGVAVKGVNIRDLRLTPVRVPPLSEQRRIAAAIEEAFSKLDAGEAGLRNVRQLLKRLRDAVLAGATSGRLVAQDHAERPGSDSLLDLDARSTPERIDGLPSSWAAVRLSSLLSEPLANGKSVRDREGGFPVLRLTSLRNGHIDLSKRKDGDWDADEAAKYVVQRGDFLVSRGNGSLSLVGRGGLVVEEPEPVAYPDTLIRVRVPADTLNPSFLSLTWNSTLVRQQLESQARTTAGIYKVNQTMLGDVRLPLPPRAEQDRIVAEVEREMSFIEACERAVDAGLERSAAMRRSVLKAAFEGRLVPRDPTDEPATVLLERIRAERAAAPTPKRRRARATS